MTTISLKKIEESYLESTKDFNNTDRSIHWKKITGKKNFKDFDKIKNFRNNHLSYGHDDSNYYNIKKFNDEIELIKEKVGEKFFLNNLKLKNIGNLKNLFTHNNLLIDPGDIHLINFFYELEKNVFNKSNIEIICEIGGGYGGLAEKILRQKKCKYILIDLPETNALSTYYLSNNFIDKKILIYSDIKNNCIDDKDLYQNDIIIITPNVKIKNIEFDLFINTRSMMEMKSSTIKKYFELIQNQLSENGYFYNVNRYIKFRAGEAIFLKDYPYDDKWKVINSSKSFNQEWIHQLITQRQQNSSNLIKIELKKIMKETKKYLQPDEFRYLVSGKFIKYSFFINLFKKILYFAGKKFFGTNYYAHKQKFYKVLNKFFFK